MDKIENIIPKVFSIDNPIAFFPIRHHSPACAYHLQKAIEDYKPDCLLIEGPSDVNPLIPHLSISKPPVAIYYSFKNESKNFLCYFPMLDYSPELVGIKMAKNKNIDVNFIDLPFGNLAQLGHNKETEALKNSYFDDYFLQSSLYIKELCEKENCRDYNELWDKLFEVTISSTDTKTFIRNMTTLCYYSRIDYPDDLLKSELNYEREAFMAENIIAYSKKYKRILVVTGGFHSIKLVELINSKDNQKIVPINSDVYLIPYSFNECDQLSGYKSGMPYPAFYQELYQKLISGDDQYAFHTVLETITKIAKMLRLNKENISLSEETVAYSIACNLASFRLKEQPSVYELLDAIRSTFIKGELNLATSFVLNKAYEALRDGKNGEISQSSPVSPIVMDFQSKMKLYKFDINNNARKEVILDIISKQQHQEKSIFLHRLCFLKIPFAQFIYGPNYHKKTDTKLVREKWEYEYNAKVISMLIEISHLGGTIKEACLSVFSKIIKEERSSLYEISELLINACKMGLAEEQEKLLKILKDKIFSENSFSSLAKCLNNLLYLQGMKNLFNISENDFIENIISSIFYRMMPFISSLNTNDENEDFLFSQTLKTLNYVLKDEKDSDIYYEVLVELIKRIDLPPSVNGAAIGLLYNAKRIASEEVISHTNRYLNSAGEIKALLGRYLKGLFLLNKDIIFYDDAFVDGLNNMLSGLEFEEFLPLLPDLRLAFTSFNPQEIDKLSKKIAKVIGIEKLYYKEVQKLPPIDEKSYRLMKELDSKVINYLKEKGFLYD